MDKLWTVAMSYIGTPHINGGQVKGAGLDCCTLPVAIYKEFGVDIPVDIGYSADWFCQRGAELIKPYLSRYFSRVNELNSGDLISFSWGRAKFAHLAMYLGGGKVIHSQADRGTEITDLDDPYFLRKDGRSRITGYWRLKDEFFIQRQ